MNVPSEKMSDVASPAPPRARGRPATGDKRRRLLDAALHMFAERGYHGTAVPEVAAAAGVGTGTLYRHFATKEALVNEVYRDAKARLGAALLSGLDDAPGERWFMELWGRLARFARAEPEAFRFLEMQDHAPYLDEESRRVEMGVLAPLWLAGQALRGGQPGAALPVDVAIALVWGAFVGLIKAERLGYLRVDDATLLRAGQSCWELVAPPGGGGQATGGPSPDHLQPTRQSTRRKRHAASDRDHVPKEPRRRARGGGRPRPG